MHLSRTNNNTTKNNRFLVPFSSTPPQATIMQGSPVDVDTVAKFGSMYKSPRVMHQLWFSWAATSLNKQVTNKYQTGKKILKQTCISKQKKKHIGHIQIYIARNQIRQATMALNTRPSTTVTDWCPPNLMIPTLASWVT